MPHSDDSALVPKPPPPRPARRDAAIEAAMRRFDGEALAPAPAKARPTWIGRPQLAWALTACLVAVIGLPTAFIVIRDGNSPVFPASPPPPPAPSRSEDTARSSVALETPLAQPAVPPTVPNTTTTAGVPAQKQEEAARVAANRPADELSAAEPSTMGYAAAPPPPPPPPPPAAPMVAEKAVGGMASNDVIVTGARVQQPNVDRKEVSANRAEVTDSLPAADWIAKDASYATFLKRLQGAARANDKGAMIKLVGFPLRVNSNGRSRVYRDAASVRADYDRIFTPAVTQAILTQRADRLFGRDQGLMIGTGQVWFDHVCTNSACYPPGPVRITAVNP